MKTLATITRNQKVEPAIILSDGELAFSSKSRFAGRRTFTLLIALLLIAATKFIFPTVISAQTTVNESFDATTFPPTGWAYVGTSAWWSRVTSGTNGNNPSVTGPHSGAGMARWDGYDNSTVGTIETLSTPVIDWSGRGANTPTFSLWLYRYNGGQYDPAPDSIGIYVNTTKSLTGAKFLCYIPRYRTYSPKVGTGVTFTGTSNPVSNSWNQYSVTIPANFNTTTNYVMLKGYNGYGYNIFIDDVQWIAYPCTTTAPTVSTPVTYCQNATASQLSATGSNLLWFTVATGGTSSGTAPTPLTNVIGTTNYWVSQTIGCEGPRAQISVIVKGKPVSSVTSFTDITCKGAHDGTITVAATGGTAPFTFSADNGASWIQEPSGNSHTFTGLAPGGPYKIIIRDINNCYSR